MTVLVSGPTGQLGSALVEALPEESLLLVRERPGRVDGRMRAVVPGWRGRADRLLVGDVQAPSWGIDVDALAPDVDCVINAAGVTDWAAGPDELHAANVLGAVRAVHLAGELSRRSGRDVRVVHVGSVFAIGGRDIVPEAPGPLPSGATSYERSKWSGERAFLAGPPPPGVRRAVVRVSALVAGTDGRRARLQGLEGFLARSVAARQRTIPHRRGARLDLVPRDVAAASLLAFAGGDWPDATVAHVALGERAPSVESVVALLNDALRARGEPPLRLRAVPAPLVRRASEALDHTLDLPRRSRNLVIGLRYLTEVRTAARARFAAIAGTDALPSLEGVDLASLLLGAPADPTWPAPDELAVPFRGFDG